MMTPLKALQEEFRYDPHIPEKPFVVQKINGLEGFRLDKQVPRAYKRCTTQRVGVNAEGAVLSCSVLARIFEWATP